LVLHATAVGCGLLDAATAPSVADRARALVALAKKQPVPRVVLAVAAYGAALANEPSEQVAELARRAVAAGVRPLPDPGEPPWFASAAMALIFAERNTEARTLLKASLTEARATANTLILPRVLAQQALLELRCGDLTAAEEDARSLLDPDRLPAPLIHRLLTTGVLVLALVERGALEEAESAVEPATTYLQMGSVSVAHLRLARGRLRLAQRRYREALMDFQAAGEIAMRIGAASPSYLPWRSQSALAHLALGEIDAARRLSGEELELARAFGAPRTLGVALRAAGLVGGGRGESLLREAIGVLDGPDNRVEQAHALTDLGALLRRSNHRMEARKILGQALDAAHRARAGLLANRAETELRATGARPRRLLLTGLEALTTSERRIAELAAEGMTNPEIAQHLFITARTVEGHLTGVFQKLGIEFRTELPAALNHFMAPGGQVFTIAPRS
jgi:DNA-binding CsgD family transcriptional regulator